MTLAQKKILRFLIIGAVAYVLLLLFYELVIRPYTPIDYEINYNIAQTGQFLFSIFGVETVIDVESDHVSLMRDAFSRTGVWIGDQCNGFKLFSLFSLLIILLPGNRKSKYWFIPLGIIIIHLVNVFRIMALLIVFEKYPLSLDFNHKYTFTILVYAVIFGLWWWWARKYSRNEQRT